jgi:predicted enzyme related to lactoylglutathione lyase
MGRIVHFEIGAGDIDRSKKFYEEVFGWKIELWPGPMPYYLITTGDSNSPGINGGMFKSKDEPVTVTTIDVKNLDEMIDKVQSNGGSIVVPKMAVPGVGWLCYFKDFEGNMFGMMQEDGEAA